MDPHDIGDANVERLVGVSYSPELPDPEFVSSLSARMQAAAHAMIARAPAPKPKPEDEHLRIVRRRLGWAMVAAAAAACVALVLHALDKPQRTPPDGPHVVIAPPAPREHVNDTNVGLTARPRAAAVEEVKIAVGSELATETGQRRRVNLADGSVLYLNSDTRVKYLAPRQLQLVKGEVYIEVSPRERDSRSEATFLVKAPNREVKALGTHFSVWADGNQSGVAVTQGKVQVSGLQALVYAGEQLVPGDKTPKASPRASYIVDWTRDLMSACESPLVPASQHAGGALVAVDPNGQETRLTMRKFHVDVHIEDGFARTTIDQTYFNETYGRLEGTFYFPLPPDASLSRLAMYVKDGNQCKLMEGGMAERDHARNVFETILHMRRDPALLEWVDGSTFKMRVFPLEPREEKRLILSYTQKAPSLYGTMHYRFPAGHSLAKVGEFSFEARVKNGAALRCLAESHPGMTIKADNLDKLMSLKENNATLKRDVLLRIVENPQEVSAEDTARFSSFTHENAQYLMLRYMPPRGTLPQQPVKHRDWVFLYEASGNRDPLLARAQIDVIRGLLENAEHDDTFMVVAANTRVHFFDSQPRPATSENIKAAVKFLEGVQLIGALDLGQAFAAVEPAVKSAKNPHLVHVGSGIATLGQRSDTALSKLIDKRTAYIGVGVGKQWGRALMKTLADNTGGYITQINPDEPINWRAFELLATLNTPRLLDLHVTDKDGKIPFLVDATTVAQGEEICAIARADFSKNEILPRKMIVKGKLAGKEFTKELEIERVAHDAGYLPRQWAKLELDRLLAEDAEKNKTAIIALSKQSYVMTPYTSLLVLESEEDYAKYKVDRGRKDHWAMYKCPEKIPVVLEWDNKPAQPAAQPEVDKTAEPRWKVLATILSRTQPKLIRSANQSSLWQPAAVTVNGGLIFGNIGLGTSGVTNVNGTSPISSVIGGLNGLSGIGGFRSIVDSDGSLGLTLNNYPSLRALVIRHDDPTTLQYALDAVEGKSHWQGRLRNNGFGLFNGFPNIAPRIEGPPVIKTYSVPGGNAEQAAKVLQEVYRSSPNLRIASIGNTQIMVYAPPADQMEIAQYVMGSTPPSASTAVIQLGNADAATIASILTDYYGGFGPQSSPFVRHDKLRNTIITMGSPDQIAEVQQAITALTGEKGLLSYGSSTRGFGSLGFRNGFLGFKENFGGLTNIGFGAANQGKSGARKVEFPSFNGANWTQVLEWLRDITGLPVLGPIRPSGTVTFVAPKGLDGKPVKYTVGEIVDFLNDSLVNQNFQIIRRQASIMVCPADEPLPLEAVKSVTVDEIGGGPPRSNNPTILLGGGKSVASNDNLTGSLGNSDLDKREFVRMTYPLKRLRSEAIASAVKGIMGPFGQVIPLEEANQLILIDTVGNLRIVAEVLRQIDKVGGHGNLAGTSRIEGPPLLRTYLVPGGNAKQVVNVLESVTGASSRPVVAAIGDNQIMLFAPHADHIEFAKIIGELAPPIGAIELHFKGDVDAERIVSVLNDFYDHPFPAGNQLKVDKARNTIIISASPDQLTEWVAAIKALVGETNVQQIENKKDPLSTTMAHQCTYVGAALTASKLNELLSDPNKLEKHLAATEALLMKRFGDFGATRLKISGKSSSHAIAYDELSNTVMVNGPPQVLRLAGLILDQLDSPENAWFSTNSLSPMYQRLAFNDSGRIFNDLLWYAPGMNTSTADIQAVLESESNLGVAPSAGTIDPDARKLIDQARSTGWQQFTVPRDGRQPGFVIRFNGIGQFAYERVLECGLREEVICDGKTLWHLYPEIGLGAKRVVSRYHRAEFANLVPWLVPSAEELARGADIRLVEKGVVGLVPHRVVKTEGDKDKATPFVQINLVFGPNGRLTERQTVMMPSKVVIERISYSDDALGLDIANAEPASVIPDLRDLVVVPMPLRTRQHLESTIKGDIANCDDDTAISLLAAACANGELPYATELCNRRFPDGADSRPGIDVLMASVGGKREVSKERLPITLRKELIKDRVPSPLSKYLAGRFAPASASEIGGPPNGFIQRLATFRTLWYAWQVSPRSASDDDRRRTLEFLGKSPLPIYDWALLVEMVRRGAGDDPQIHAALIDACKDFGDQGELGFIARHEVAQGVFNSGGTAEGRVLFRKLYKDTLETGTLPPIERVFRDALAKNPDDKAPGFADLMRESVRTLAKRGQRLELLAVPWQAAQLGEQELANELVAQVLETCEPGLVRNVAKSAAVQFYMQNKQPVKADLLMQELVTEGIYKDSPDFWRLAAAVAAECKQPARALANLERALDLEFREMPPVVDIQLIRSDYSQLLGQYQEVANAMALLEQAPPKEFLTKVIRTADRWRSLEPDPTTVCQLTAKILQTVGALDLAWDYLTTPLDSKPNEAAPWLSLAKALQDNGSVMLADKAFAQAFLIEPTNAQILWDRATNLVQAGRGAEAREVYRVLAEGQWQERFQWIQNEAKGKVGKR